MLCFGTSAGQGVQASIEGFLACAGFFRMGPSGRSDEHHQKILTLESLKPQNIVKKKICKVVKKQGDFSLSKPMRAARNVRRNSGASKPFFMYHVAMLPYIRTVNLLLLHLFELF